MFFRNWNYKPVWAPKKKKKEIGWRKDRELWQIQIEGNIHKLLFVAAKLTDCAMLYVKLCNRERVIARYNIQRYYS